jgi:hypothetical protein
MRFSNDKAGKIILDFLNNRYFANNIFGANNTTRVRSGPVIVLVGGFRKGDNVRLKTSDLAIPSWVAVVIVVSAGDTGGASPAAWADEAEVLARVRGAVGWDEAVSLLIEGDVEAFGSKGRYSLRTGSGGRFVERVEAPLGGSVGDDGTTGWKVDWSGMPRRLEEWERDADRLFLWACTGQWLDPAAPVVTRIKPQDDGGVVVLAVGVKGGRPEAEFRIDRATWLPRSLTCKGAQGTDVLEFSRYLEHRGRKVAGTVTRRNEGILVSSYEVTSVRPAPAVEGDPFAPVTARPDDTRYDRKAPGTVRLERAKTGHLLVYVTVDGDEPCAFILDSGAGATVVARDTARKLGLAAVGRMPLRSIFGTVPAPVYRARTLSLGPVTVANPYLVEMDLAPLNAAFGRKVEGVVGYDLFSRCVVDLALADDAVTLRDANERLEVEGARWLPLALPGRHPAVPANFAGGREGLFRLDLGASGGPAGNVTFHNSTVQEFHLLDGQAVVRGKAGTVDIAMGEIPWFELAGHRFEKPRVLFAVSEDGVLGKVDTLGNIGVEFLKPFRVVFDYPHGRIALVERRGR